MGDINQDDIDKLLADAMAGIGDAPASAAAPAAPAEEASGVASQDDIDALFAVVGNSASAPAAAPVEAPVPVPEENISGMASQDDIDALFSAVAGEEPPSPVEPPAAQAQNTPAVKAEEVAPGAASQDDIDALFSNFPSAPPPAKSPAPKPPAAPAPAVPPAAADPAPGPQTIPEMQNEDLRGLANQDDIDALFSNIAAAPAAPAAPATPVARPAPAPAKAETPVAKAKPGPGGPVAQDDLNALFAELGGTESAAAGMQEETADLDALLSNLSPDGKMPTGEAGEDGDESGTAVREAGPDQPDQAFDLSGGPAPTAAVEIDANAQTTVVNEFDMEQLLREVAGAAPDPPPPTPGTKKLYRPSLENAVTDTQVLDPFQASLNARAEAGPKARPAPAPAPQRPVAIAPATGAGSANYLPPAPTVPPPPPSPQPPPAGVAGAPGASAGRREYSVLYGAGEVDGVASQIVALLNAMSEKAQGYMQAWIAADSEAKELRTRALAEERKRDTLASEKMALEAEKTALAQQIQELRKRIGELEGAKIAHEETRRTLEASHQVTTRELENRIAMLLTESQTLKDEMVRVRNTATGVDMESRRARFELDRLKNEVESERMERLRIQRALENREKEIQAMQAQSSGQASSLFIDELHRLVRRLESELDARTSGASEALRQLDRLEVPETMVPAAANLRAALMLALGQEHEGEDALKSLGREAARTRGGMALQSQKAELVSFESALSTYSLVQAVDVAGALLREASTTPAVLMRKVYQCPALRRPEVADHLADLSRLLEGLRTVQEAKDRTRGVESGDSEVFYIHLFDFLHNLVRLKLVNRLSGDIWRLFLDLRGRFSFITSDKQWADYRDGMLKDKNV